MVGLLLFWAERGQGPVLDIPANFEFLRRKKTVFLSSPYLGGALRTLSLYLRRGQAWEVEFEWSPTPPKPNYERGGKPGVPGITEGSEFQTMDSWQTISFWIERSTCRRVSLINLRWSASKSFSVWYFQTLLRNYYTWCLRKAQWLIWLTYVSHVILRESSYLTWVKLSYVSHAILRESSSSRRTYVRNYIVFSKNDVSHAILLESSCLTWVKLSYCTYVRNMWLTYMHLLAIIPT